MGPNLPSENLDGFRVLHMHSLQSQQWPSTCRIKATSATYFSSTGCNSVFQRLLIRTFHGRLRMLHHLFRLTSAGGGYAYYGANYRLPAIFYLQFSFLTMVLAALASLAILVVLLPVMHRKMPTMLEFDTLDGMSHQYHDSLHRGLPVAILELQEQVVGCGVQGFWWPFYLRTAGYYCSCLLAVAIILWALTCLLMIAVPQLGALLLAMTGITITSVPILYAALLNFPPIVSGFVDFRMPPRLT